MRVTLPAMRHVLLLCLINTPLCLPLPAFAQSEAAPPSAPAIEQRNLDLPASGTGERKDADRLLAALKRERDPEAANRLATEILSVWNDSQSATVNLLMQWADAAISEKRNAAALDFLDQAIMLKPDYVAAWNRRATYHYTTGSYRKSMADIQRVLVLEPRHFGALAGLAAILSENGREEMAMRAWERYLEVYPADRQAQDAVSKLSEKLAGDRT